MSVTVTPFLRNVLALDAVATGATALLMIAGGSLVASLTGLPQPLLFWAGLALVPFVALIAHYARRPRMPRIVMIDVIAINALWVAGSIAILVSGAVQPNLPGYAFVAAQAAVVALFAVLQYRALRGAGALAA